MMMMMIHPPPIILLKKMLTLESSKTYNAPSPLSNILKTSKLVRTPLEMLKMVFVPFRHSRLRLTKVFFVLFCNRYRVSLFFIFKNMNANSFNWHN